MIETTVEHLAQLIGEKTVENDLQRKQIGILQRTILENAKANELLREELEQTKADAESAKLAGEQDAKMAKDLADELQKSRNGSVVELAG